jgi:O-antigen/teichoic acid export membrane protein
MQIVTKIFGLISAILLANYLNTQLFGKYTYTFAFASLFIPFCDFGMDTYIIRQVARDSSDRIGATINSVFKGKTIFTISTFIIASIASLLMESFSPEYAGLILLVGIVTFSRTYWTTFSSVFRAINQFIYDVVIYSFTRIGEFIVVMTTILFHRDMYFLLFNLAIVNLASIGITFVVLNRRFIKLAFNSTLNDVRKSLRGGLPFALSIIFTAIYFNLDTVLVKKFINESAAGIYRASYNLILPMMMVTTSLTGAVFPYVSQNFKTHADDVRNIVRESVIYLLMIALPGATVGAFLAKDVILWLYSPGYLESSTSLMILVWFLPIVYLTNLFGNVLGAIDDQPYVLKVAIVNVLFNLIANIILIPIYAQNGAAVVIVLTELVGLGLLSVRIHRKIGSVISFNRVFRIMIACGIVLIYLIFRLPLNIILTFVLVAIIYISSLFIFRAISTDEIKQLIRVMQKNKTPQESGIDKL